jgi:serine/threonine protein kinase/tetratricopeptide (TPR) repeat protein
LPAQLVSHYRVLGQLGRGGMGVVYRAEDTSLRRTVALKFLPAHLTKDLAISERLRHEARLASSLNHPNICTIYEVGEDTGEVFIAMEYVEGRPLSESIRAEGLPLETTLRYGRQLASALAHAHDRSVVHGDLKPSNIIVTPGGDVKILDFGLARRSDPAEFDRQTLETASVESRPGLGGTLRYMAPEQMDASPASQFTDLWSLGIVLYEMAAGSRPFSGENLYLLCNAILHDPPRPLPPRVPLGLASIIFRCLEKEPARRYQRAGEVRAALEALTPSSQEDVVPAPLPAPRRVFYFPIAAAILLLLSVFGVYKFRDKIGILGSAGLVPHPVLLGVLPPSPSGDSSQSAFNDGLADTLNSRLSELSARHAFAVIPMREILGKNVKTADGARDQFGVNLVLALNVQRAADKIRVNYSLVDTRSHRQVRGGTVTAAAADPFALQDRVFESIASAMELQLAPEEKQPSGYDGTTQAAAYDSYVQGRGYLQDYVVPEKVESAITLFQDALEKDPNYAAATAGLGEAYWRKYQLTHDQAWAKAAIETCDKATRQGPRLAAAHSCLGQAYMAQGQYEKAADQYRRTLVLEPTSDDAYGGLASAYEHLGQPADAEQAFKQAITLRPGYWATYNWLGLFYMDHARYEEAVGLFSQVISLVPDSFTGYYNLGAVRILQGKYVEAVPLLEKSLSIRPSADAISNLATAYFQMHRYADSAVQFQKAVQLDPKNYLFWGNLGDAFYWSPGRRPEAADAYGQAISLGEEKLRRNPHDAQLLSSLGMYHAMRGGKKAALDNLDASLRLQPKSPDLLFNAGIIYQQLGDANRALDSLERAVSLGISPEVIRDTPNFDALRDNRRYLSLLGNQQKK